MGKIALQDDGGGWTALRGSGVVDDNWGMDIDGQNEELGKSQDMNGEERAVVSGVAGEKRKRKHGVDNPQRWTDEERLSLLSFKEDPRWEDREYAKSLGKSLHEMRVLHFSNLDFNSTSTHTPRTFEGLRLELVKLQKDYAKTKRTVTQLWMSVYPSVAAHTIIVQSMEDTENVKGEMDDHEAFGGNGASETPCITYSNTPSSSKTARGKGNFGPRVTIDYSAEEQSALMRTYAEWKTQHPAKCPKDGSMNEFIVGKHNEWLFEHNYEHMRSFNALRMRYLKSKLLGYAHEEEDDDNQDFGSDGASEGPSTNNKTRRSGLSASALSSAVTNHEDIDENMSDFEGTYDSDEKSEGSCVNESSICRLGLLVPAQIPAVEDDEDTDEDVEEETRDSDDYDGTKNSQRRLKRQRTHRHDRMQPVSPSPVEPSPALWPNATYLLHLHRESKKCSNVASGSNVANDCSNRTVSDSTVSSPRTISPSSASNLKSSSRAASRNTGPSQSTISPPSAPRRSTAAPIEISSPPLRLANQLPEPISSNRIPPPRSSASSPLSSLDSRSPSPPPDLATRLKVSKQADALASTVLCACIGPCTYKFHSSSPGSDPRPTPHPYWVCVSLNIMEPPISSIRYSLQNGPTRHYEVAERRQLPATAGMEQALAPNVAACVEGILALKPAAANFSDTDPPFSDHVEVDQHMLVRDILETKVCRFLDTYTHATNSVPPASWDIGLPMRMLKAALQIFRAGFRKLQARGQPVGGAYKMLQREFAELVKGNPDVIEEFQEWLPEEERKVSAWKEMMGSIGLEQSRVGWESFGGCWSG